MLFRKMFPHVATLPIQLHFTRTSSQVRDTLDTTSGIVYLFFVKIFCSMSKSFLLYPILRSNLNASKASNAFSTVALSSLYRHLQYFYKNKFIAWFKECKILQLIHKLLYFCFRNYVCIANCDSRKWNNICRCLSGFYIYSCGFTCKRVP